MLLRATYACDPLFMMIPGCASWTDTISHKAALQAVNNKLSSLIESRPEVEKIYFEAPPGTLHWKLKWKFEGQDEETVRVGKDHTFGQIREMLPPTIRQIIRTLSTAKIDL